MISTPKLQQLLQETDEENREIIKAKYSGTPFRDMSFDQLKLACKLLLADLKLITGGLLPTGPSLERLAEIITSSFKEDYPQFTVPEIQLAIKRHSKDVIIYGKDINLTYINQILNCYLPSKQYATQIEDKHNEKFYEERQVDTEHLENLTRKNIQQAYEKYLNTGEFNILSDVEYGQLIKDGLVSNDLHEDFIFRSILILKSKYQKFVDDTLKKETDPESIGGLVQSREYKDKLMVLQAIEKEAKAEAVRFAFIYSRNKGISGMYQQVK